MVLGALCSWEPCGLWHFSECWWAMWTPALKAWQSILSWLHHEFSGDLWTWLLSQLLPHFLIPKTKQLVHSYWRPCSSCRKHWAASKRIRVTWLVDRVVGWWLDFILHGPEGPTLVLADTLLSESKLKRVSSKHATLAFYGCLLHTLNSFWLVRRLHRCQTKCDLESQQCSVQLLQSWGKMAATMMWHSQGEVRHTDLVQTSSP